MPTTSATSAATNTASSSLATSTSDVKAQTDRFLKILLTQLQNQNPLDPLKPEEFSTQLAQFSQLEQAVNTNSKLDTLIKASASPSISPLTYLGNTVDFTSNKAPVQNEAATWTYETVGATNVAIEIRDDSGKLLYSGKGDASTGPHTLTLNSLSGVADGTTLKLQVSATDASGKTVAPTITARAKITAVDTKNGVSTLEADGLSISTDSIVRVATPTTPTTASSQA